MRILLVDDDELLTNVISTHLIEQHYAVDIANTGEKCWEYLSVMTYDLIVLDVMLPDADGRELCRRLRQQKYEIPILMLTAQNASEDKVEGLDSGADDYVVKPIIIKELMAHIRALLRREFRAKSPILKWEKLQLNPRSCSVTYGGKNVELTPKEYAILELFLRNTNKVHTLDSIIDNAWSFEDPPSVDAVRTHIKGLRQKLKEQGAPKDFIATVYGFGYRLKPQDTEEPISPEPSPDTEAALDVDDAALSAAIAKIWEQNQDEVHNRIQRLVTLREALEAGNLTQPIYEKSLSAAHKLAGSLGCYGYSEGSNLAKEMELILNEQQETLQDSLKDIALLIDKLGDSIDLQPPTHHLPHTQPIILLISQDQSFIKALEHLAPNNNLAFTFIHKVSDIWATLDSQWHHAILIDLQSKAQVDALLLELEDAIATVPILARLHEGDFNDRLKLLENGVYNVFSSSIPAPQLLQEIKQVIHTLGQQSKILIVDDDPQILSFLETSLGPWGLQVFTLNDSTQFWQTLETINPDLVILDIEMPNIDGLELCQLMRANEHWQHLPVLFLTLHEEKNIQSHAFVVGANDFIRKPVEVNHLANRIQHRLRQHPRPKQ